MRTVLEWVQADPQGFGFGDFVCLWGSSSGASTMAPWALGENSSATYDVDAAILNYPSIWYRAYLQSIPALHWPDANGNAARSMGSIYDPELVLDANSTANRHRSTAHLMLGHDDPLIAAAQVPSAYDWDAAGGHPALLNTLTNGHSAWNGIMLRKMRRDGLAPLAAGVGAEDVVLQKVGTELAFDPADVTFGLGKVKTSPEAMALQLGWLLNRIHEAP